MIKNKKKVSLGGFLLFLILGVTCLNACSTATQSTALTPTPTTITSKSSQPSVTPTSTSQATKSKTAPKTTSTAKQKTTTKTNSVTTTTVSSTAIQVSWNATVSTGYTTNWANIRSTPYTDGAVVTMDQPDTTVQLYGTVNGESEWNGATWYRISSKQSAPEYIYSGLITTTNPNTNAATPNDGGKNPGPGQVILVDLTTESLVAFDNGKEVFSTLVTTGQPGLLTPTGTFHVFAKLSPTTFISPWPEGSVYYYPPTYINYALEFLSGGYFLHDATWRESFGPGADVPHTNPDGTVETGSHGCIEMPLADARWLYNWASIGTTVTVYYS